MEICVKQVNFTARCVKAVPSLDDLIDPSCTAYDGDAAHLCHGGRFCRRMVRPLQGQYVMHGPQYAIALVAVSGVLSHDKGIADTCAKN